MRKSRWYLLGLIALIAALGAGYGCGKKEEAADEAELIGAVS